MAQQIEVPPATLNAGIENAIRMAQAFTDDLWKSTGTPKHWCQMEIGDGIIALEVGVKHIDGQEELPFVTYRFNSDGTYAKYVHA